MHTVVSIAILFPNKGMVGCTLPVLLLLFLFFLQLVLLNILVSVSVSLARLFV